ncbi:glycoside hydrolase family 3 protein [Marvinbryantia formatexigens]|nr:glycoside hydrolase family 3 protein [Marvinbryantia formatexigens]UWO23174.1 glycoside hydrolase family 3 C-terminal domain-containing protein [Marvinbryantia formatexigens DSM 14469]SDG02341.1 beta-glucosidase [Marvinbryantia formatexigens]
MRKFFAAKSPEITKRELEHMELARAVAGECMVLLENDGTLPLAAGGKLALYGMGARHTIKGGTGSGDVNTRSNVTIEQGLAEAGYTITTGGWLDRNERKRTAEKDAYLRWMTEEAERRGCSPFLVSFSDPFAEPAPEMITEEDWRASETDTAVYVISRNSGEGSDRYDRPGDYRLYPEEKEQLAFLGRSYAKVVLVLNIGGVMDLSEIKEIPGIGAVLLMTQLGNIGGQVLADVLSGRVTPSGKLTDTWAKRYEDYPSAAAFSHNDGDVDDEYYTEGIYVGYRYFDTFGVKPLYCFGYGKSYTEFAIRTENVVVKNGQVILSVLVKNTGSEYAGKEVVQVYYSAPEGTLEKPYQELAAFAKTGLLAPGESEKLEIAFAVRDMASYCEKCASWVLEKGDYILRIGSSSADTQAAAVLTLKETVKTEILKNLFADAELPEELHADCTGAVTDDLCDAETMEEPGCDEGAAEAVEENGCGNRAAEEPGCGAGAAGGATQIPHILLCAAEIETRQAQYMEERELYTTDQTRMLTLADVKNGTCTVEELTAQLTVEELAELCVGTLRADGGSIVGNASYTVPGAAGDTSALLQETRGIKNMILADGPAGLRLQPVFKTNKDGELLPGGEILGDSYVSFDKNLEESQTDTYYQYCTAIPIGWALAQSWNLPALERIGAMVGREMEEFGIDLWLAPALNIHRNPLCGRNFEYYSEDPYVSGKAAAAITKGVQSCAGKGTTIKHFAANSQEDNRYFTNSHVSERALREIYLKGFEIAVKESQPFSIMTSYNLINGTHTANSRDLLQAAARDEWGFEGVIMTDWFTSQEQPALTGEAKVKYPISASTGCIYAGNDIQMPGCQKNVDDITEAVKSGREIDGYSVTLADLQYNAANVIRAVCRTSR